jgi:hypothetical protein
MASWLCRGYHPFPTQSTPMPADRRKVAGKCGRVMLGVPDVDDLVFQGGRLVPGEAALRGREVERINAGVDHVIALIAIFEKVIASKGLTSLGRTVRLPRNTAYELWRVLVSVLAARRRLRATAGPSGGPLGVGG